MSALWEATALNAKFSAQASIHVRTCSVCPDSFSDFLDRLGCICFEGDRILRLIEASKLAIARVVAKPSVRRGHCLACGYLFGLVDGEHCEQCAKRQAS